MKVAYQGAQGAFSEAAALGFFKDTKDLELVPYASFDKAVAAVEGGQAAAAVLPIENSLSGTFHAVYDRLLHSTLHICGEHSARDDCCLVTHPGTQLSDVQEVYSHAHVLEQCSVFLAKLNASLCATQDTAGAVSFLTSLSEKGRAVVCSGRAAELHGLTVLARDLADSAGSCTRYLVVQAGEASAPPPGSVRCKTSLAVSLPNRPGSLFKALSAFALRDINVAKIESRPSARAGSLHTSPTPWEYINYLDVEGSTRDEKMQQALRSLEDFATQVKILGCYAKYQAPTSFTEAGQPFASM